MTQKLRFAPSPTGLLHIGNARTALIAWLYARHHKGKFVLRFDDTDRGRSKDSFVEAIYRDLNWLGMDYDSEARQSERLPLYEAAAEKLKASGRLYPCFETPQELDFKRRRQLSQGKPPLYDRGALKLTVEEIKAFEAEGRKPHWRFKIASKPVEWNDMVHGPLSFQGENISDPVLIREDGSPLFTLSGMVDDIEMGITHIIRGEDHISNTAVQIQITEALGTDPGDFSFAHLPLLMGEHGEGLSKRFGSLSLEALREQKIEPLALATYLTKLGTSEDITPVSSLETLVRDFDMTKFSKSSPKFSMEGLERLNTKLLHSLTYHEIRPRLIELGLYEVTEHFWEAVHGNLTTLEDIRHFWQICEGDVTPVIEDPAYIREALSLLPSAPWDETTWSTWTQSLKEKTGRKGKDLFMPLRLALTGESHGPEMKVLLPLIGPAKATTRLQGEK